MNHVSSFDNESLAACLELGGIGSRHTEPYFEERREAVRDTLVGVFAPKQPTDMTPADHMLLVNKDHWVIKQKMMAAGWYPLGEPHILQRSFLPPPKHDGDTLTVAESDVPQFVDGTNWFYIQGRGDVEPPDGLWSIRRFYVANNGDWHVDKTYQSPHIDVVA